MGKLDGKVALISGGARGQGAAEAQLFAREGAKVVVADLVRETGEETVKLIKEAGGDAVFAQTDVSKPDQVEAMVKAAVDNFGGLDCAINNAIAFGDRTPVADIAFEEWNRLMSVNFTGVFLCMKYELQAMLKRGGGAIVNIGSGNEHSAVGGLSWYLGAKQGIYAAARCAAIEYGPHGIRVNSVGPGTMWTPGMRETAAKEPHHIEHLASLTPLGRIAEPEEVAEAAIWLCTDQASYVTGHTLLAEGGAVLGQVFKMKG
jgi:NAD(P)-dependent dehydrogenase (short-subunit alcohol dehydrogenase family)